MTQGAIYNATLGEYILPYDTVRTAANPDALLLAFMSATYAAAAEAGNWDRASLEFAKSGTLGSRVHQWGLR